MPFKAIKSDKSKDSSMPGDRYTNVSIPEGLRTELERLFADLEKKKIDLGYKSLSEFCKDALRRRIEEIRKGYLSD